MRRAEKIDYVLYTSRDAAAEQLWVWRVDIETIVPSEMKTRMKSIVHSVGMAHHQKHLGPVSNPAVLRSMSVESHT